MRSSLALMSWIWLFLVPTVVLLIAKYRKTSKRCPLPPGPPGDPLIGHLRKIPLSGHDEYFYELSLKYGEVTYLNALGHSLVVLNSVQAANELLDKRGANYSDRPNFPLLNLMGIGNTLPALRYGAEWRKQRAMFHQCFNKEKSKEYRLIYNREARILAQKLIINAEDRFSLFLRYSTSIIIEINYGHRIKSNEDPYLKIASECSGITAELGPPGATPVDMFPSLRHFPSWFPGTYYATYAKKSLPRMKMLFQYPYEKMKEQMEKGPVGSSVLASMLEDLHETGEENSIGIERVQSATAIAYLAGAEATASTLSFFLLAMVLHPEFQYRAQEEIDRVLGPGRLPELQDRVSLPYVECILQETMRWHQPTPAGVPHVSMEDDMYNDMLIPKGSLVIPNVRGMTLDKAVYKDPFNFDPARFLTSPEGRGEPHPTGQFGFGRRICPGRHLGQESVWIAIATILATMEISRAIDENGKEIIPTEYVATTGFTSYASPFPCDIKPRSGQSLDLLQRLIDSN